MESSISLNEVIGTINDGDVEICSTADAAYDGTAQKVVVTLDAFARHGCVHGDGHPLLEPRLPPADEVIEHLPREEASPFARDEFNSWCKKVRVSVPDNLQLQT